MKHDIKSVWPKGIAVAVSKASEREGQKERGQNQEAETKTVFVFPTYERLDQTFHFEIKADRNIYPTLRCIDKHLYWTHFTQM